MLYEVITETSDTDSGSETGIDSDTVTSDTDTVDIPDHFTPLVEDYCAAVILGQPMQKSYNFV